MDDGRCVTDGPGHHGNYERCEVQALRQLYVRAVQYDVEISGGDGVTINGVGYGHAAPPEVKMNQGGIWSWGSDCIRTRAGFKLCATAVIENTGSTKVPWLFLRMYVYMYVCTHVCM